jgi:hypothetical protein
VDSVYLDPTNEKEAITYLFPAMIAKFFVGGLLKGRNSIENLT